MAPTAIQFEFQGGVFVAPSGDPSGATDWRNIQDAITACSVRSYSPRTVYLAGQYAVNDLLVIGDTDSVHPTQPACLVGAPHAWISYCGPEVDDYLVRLRTRLDNNFALHNTPRLANLVLYGNAKCRGALVAGCYGGSRFENLFFQYFKRSALDISGCWTSSWNNIRIAQCCGYALRAVDFNNAQLNNVHIGNHYGMRHVDNFKVPGTATDELIQFAGQNGRDAAVAKYGAKLVEDFPADDDQGAITYGGKPWNMQTDKSMQHAPVYVSGVGSRNSNFAFESCRTIDDPLLVIAGACLRFDTIYDEGNLTRLCKVRLNGTVNGMAVNNQIQNMSQFSASVPTPCEALVEIVGQSCNNTVEDVYTQNISKTYLRHNGGTHRNNVVRNALDFRYPSIPQANWITEVNGAAHEQTVPTGLYG